MNLSLKTISLWLLAGLFTSTACENFLGGDTNVDPNKVSEITLNTALPPLLVNVSSNHYSTVNSTSQVTQQLASYFASGATIQNLFTMSGTWSNIYLTGLTNAKVLKQLADDMAAPHYEGIADVITAVNLGLATDSWGDIPYSEALLGEENIKPVFDSQKDIYTDIQALLTSAIGKLEASSSSKSPGSDDLIYNGDLDKWVKLAHALKARYHIHLTKHDTQEAAQNALNEIADAFTSNDDDFQLSYNDRNFNPFHSNIALQNNTGNYTLTFSEQFINALNGTTYGGVEDPRLPIVASKGTSANFLGLKSGLTTGNTVNFTENTWYSRREAPIMMATYAEVKFIEAEARFLINGGTPTSTGTTTDAYNAYLEGIEAHMTKLGVDPQDINDYLNEPTVGVGEANLTLGHIMKEKWIALFLNPEVWTDMRRYDFSTNVYKDLTLPNNHNPDLNGKWIRRAWYPLDEFNRNGDNVNPIALDVPMWWDSN